MHKIKIRLFMYFFGLFIMTMGIALSVKSNLGVSPVSSIPYTMTCVWGLEMGLATIIFHVVLVLLQILILRRKFQLKNLLQILIGVLFGYCTTFSNWCMSFVPDTSNLAVRIGMILLSVVLVAVGLFFYVPADIVPLAGEGFIKTMSDTLDKKFSSMKIAFDVSMVAISLILCIILIHSLGSVGIGTVLAAVLVGITLKFINRFFGNWRNQVLA